MYSYRTVPLMHANLLLDENVYRLYTIFLQLKKRNGGKDYGIYRSQSRENR